MTSPRLEICGGIGVGKSTLARRLALDLPDHQVVHENYSDNPLWHMFYTAPHCFTKEKNISFLAQHVAEIKAIKDAPFIVDFCLLQDLAYAKISRIPGHYEVMEAVFQHLTIDLPPPAVIIHIKTSLSRQINQIKSRGRSVELKLDEAMLIDLNKATQEVLQQTKDESTLIIPILSEEIHEASTTTDIIKKYQGKIRAS